MLAIIQSIFGSSPGLKLKMKWIGSVKTYNKIFKPTGTRVDSITKSASVQHSHRPAA